MKRAETRDKGFWGLLFVAVGRSETEIVGLSKVLFSLGKVNFGLEETIWVGYYLRVVFFEEGDHAYVVLEGDDVSFGEQFQLWHVRLGCEQGAKDVLRKANRVELSSRTSVPLHIKLLCY